MSNLNQQIVLNPPTKTKDNVYVHGFLHIYTGLLPHSQGFYWGIDPGVNFGIAVLHNDQIAIYQGELVTAPEPGMTGHWAYELLQELIASYNQQGARVVVEGAAYAKAYGQVKLEEIRQSFYLAGMHSLAVRQVFIIPPKTIRKVVFKNGDTVAHEIWSNLNHNAAAALSMALYAKEL